MYGMRASRRLRLNIEHGGLRRNPNPPRMRPPPKSQHDWPLTLTLTPSLSLLPSYKGSVTSLKEALESGHASLPSNGVVIFSKRMNSFYLFHNKVGYERTFISGEGWDEVMRAEKLNILFLHRFCPHSFYTGLGAYAQECIRGPGVCI